jgi:PAS domain S-box-containing protein
MNEVPLIDRSAELTGKERQLGPLSHPFKPLNEASLIVDVAGRITHCSRAAIELLGQKSEALIGRAVAAVIEGLPISPDTPGYNLAYAILQATEGQWAHRNALQTDGKKIPVDIQFSDVMKQLPFFITLTLKPTNPMYWSQA